MYSPKIKEKLVRKLFFLKTSYASIGIKKHMTEMVNEAVENYIKEKLEELTKQREALIIPEELLEK